MSGGDIYGMKEPPVSSRSKRSVVSQRRDEYLRARGEEIVPHHRHHHHRQHSRSLGQKIALFGFGVLALLTVLSIIGAVVLAARNGQVVDRTLLENKHLLDEMGSR